MNYLMDNIESERLVFRKLVPDDFSLWLPFHEDKRTSQHWEGIPTNPVDACKVDFDRTFYRYKNNLGGKLALLKKDTKEFIGLCGLLIQEIDGKQELEIAYSLLPKYWKKGFATEAAIQCKIYATEYKLSSSLISIISITNIPSQKVALQNKMVIDYKTSYNNNPVYIYRVQL